MAAFPALISEAYFSLFTRVGNGLHNNPGLFGIIATCKREGTYQLATQALHAFFTIHTYIRFSHLSNPPHLSGYTGKK
jgi:hypothetical protein